MGTIDRPPPEVLAAFGAGSAVPERLGGGRGRTWRAGGIVLRPRDDPEEADWRSQVLSSLGPGADFRTARPIAASGGGWGCHGWEAWQWLPGKADESRVADVLRAGAAFHRAVAFLGRPAFIDRSDHPWSRADRMAWGEQPLPRDPLLDRLVHGFRPVRTPSQLIHGDLLGNVMFAAEGPPAIIDWAPYWRPAGLGAAIAAVDAVCWHALPVDRLARLGTGIPEWGQLLVRALAFRIAALHNLQAWDAALHERHQPVAAAVTAIS